MKVKNFTQMKNALATHCFEVVDHYVFPERMGEVRYVSKMQTNGMYSCILRNGDKKVNSCNNGRGLWCEFGKAHDWKINGELCTYYPEGRWEPVWTIRILDETIE